MILLVFLISGGLAGLAGISEVAGPVGKLDLVISPGYGFTAIIVAFLGRLNPVGIVVAGLVLALSFSAASGRRSSLGMSSQIGPRLPGHAALLRARLRHLHPLPHALRPHASRPPQAASGLSRTWAWPRRIIVTIIIASTPLLLAALGELVAERSGVLNLGVEGMMIMGAVCGFIAATSRPASRSPASSPRSLAGMLMASLFGFVTLVLVANQVARGPGADAARHRPCSALIGERLCQHSRHQAAAALIPGLSDLPFVGPIVFGQDPADLCRRGR